jgi:hypothetical protein
MRKQKDLPRPYDDHDLDSAYQAGIMYERKRILKLVADDSPVWESETTQETLQELIKNDKKRG